MVNIMELQEIVKRLTGPYEPTGMHDVDIKRFENAKNLTSTLHTLIGEIWACQDLVSDSRESSVVDIREHLKEFLQSLHDYTLE